MPFMMYVLGIRRRQTAYAKVFIFGVSHVSGYVITHTKFGRHRLIGLGWRYPKIDHFASTCCSGLTTTTRATAGSSDKNSLPLRVRALVL